MDYFKFGNLICSLREERGLTQKELAGLLDVSDKAISKWENGQALPRAETFEALASALGTTVENLIALSRENTLGLTVKNSFGTVLHFMIDGEITSLTADEEKTVILDSSLDEHSVSVYGDLKLGELLEKTEEAPQGIKEIIKQKGMSVLLKRADRFLEQHIIKIKCGYTLTDLKSGDTVTVENEMFSTGDRLLISRDFDYLYPKLVTGCKVKLISAECINKADVFADFRHCALTSELALSIPVMLLLYPFRKIYFKNALKPKSLIKTVAKADVYIKKEAEKQKKAENRKHPVLRGIFCIIATIIMFCVITAVFDTVFVSSDKPYLVADDFSKITYQREEYVRIDELPKDAAPETFLNADVWTDARIDGQSKFDQSLSIHKVCENTDRDGNRYLWLITDYTDNAFDEETGVHKEYDDFDEPYVYMLTE